MHSSATTTTLTTMVSAPPQEKNNNNKALQVYIPEDHQNDRCLIKTPKKKKRGAMYFVKVALFMIKSGSNKSKALSSASSNLGQLVGSVRPLHLQADPEDQPNNPPALTYHSSPAHSEDSAFSSPTGSRSRADTPYASAVGLSDMVSANEDEEWDGDKMIDAKAEEFIANFYNEMKLQRRYSINERSLR